MMMRNIAARTIFTAMLVFSLAGGVHAGKGNGKEPGGGGGRGGDDPQAVTASTIMFRDLLTDRVGSDNGTPYVHGEDAVEAFIGTQANLGNVWLKLANSPRGLWLDFTDCISACNPPFDSGVNDLSAIKLEADKVQSDGLWGMAVGTTIFAPMRIFYEFDDGQGPGFVEFNPKQPGSSPCRNKGNYVAVTRNNDTAWEVSADETILGCVALPGGRELGGIYLMPFSFTVAVNP